LLILSGLIGISIYKKQYCYLIWILSELDPLIIDYETVENKSKNIPFINDIEILKDVDKTLSAKVEINYNSYHILDNFIN